MGNKGGQYLSCLCLMDALIDPVASILPACSRRGILTRI